LTIILTFPGCGPTTLATVGGKGYSVIRLAEAGFVVPPGAVLPTAYFTQWYDEIKASPAWRALSEAMPEHWPDICRELKELSGKLSPSPAQRRALEEVRAYVARLGDVRLAVRSSSPDEDLATASFAGCYSTRLGVRLSDLEEAVRECFASSLDARVFLYKREHGFDVLSPRIAVVVQQQIDSEVAGVGFSLNPLTNDFDEALINANWGQGESVVAGLASPDQFVVDKLDLRVVDRQLGAKRKSLWLDLDGGTCERSSHRSSEFTLGDARLSELTEALCRIERLFEKPVDVEWAWADGRLHMLQARPITTFVPLAPEMMTRPGERRRLYADAALSKGMTTNAPLSPMLLDSYRDLLTTFLAGYMGIDVTPEKGLVFAAGGRLYTNLSNMMWLASMKKMAKGTLPSDALMGEIFAAIDEERYRAAARPPWLRLGMLWSMLRLLWLVRGMLGSMLATIVAPRRTFESYQRSITAYESTLTELDYSLSLEELNRRSMSAFWRQPGMGVLMAAIGAHGLVDRLVGKRSPDAQALAAKLKLGMSGDVVVEMGIALYRMAKLLTADDFADLDRLADRIQRREMPAELLRAWDEFLSTYGWRGPLEMDVASPRYADDYRLALRQMSFMSVDDMRFDPEAAHRRQVEARREAYEQLMHRFGWLRRLLLRRAYTIVDLFAGSRDMPKHQIALSTYVMRKRVLIEGNRLVRAGRLDAAGEVFDLTLADLEAANTDPSLDLRAVRKERTAFLETLKSQVTEFPQVIDSRGRILRPAPREEKPSELIGSAMSSGVASGPVKVLRGPNEKPIDKGDVLVAYTTDPGWTPLFVNAAAVVLEIGGTLQHGAVVAREYGKPCVAGIDRVMTKLRDGQIVEVDGTAGVVRLVSATRP
jgi:phosphohistidine swiveling domain-containing protein